MSTKERTTMTPPWLRDDDALTGSFNCDICDETIGNRSYLWTCDGGNRTVLHAGGYDVCDACFRRHTGIKHYLPLLEDFTFESVAHSDARSASDMSLGNSASGSSTTFVEEDAQEDDEMCAEEDAEGDDVDDTGALSPVARRQGSCYAEHALVDGSGHAVAPEHAAQETTDTVEAICEISDANAMEEAMDYWLLLRPATLGLEVSARAVDQPSRIRDTAACNIGAFEDDASDAV